MDILQPLTDQIQSYWIGLVKLLPQIGLAIIVLILTAVIASFAGRMARAALNTARLRRALVDLVKTLCGLVVWILGILLAATIVFPSVTPAQMIGALGVGGIAVGLAFRDIFENFMAGVMIMVRVPMRIGDTIEVNGIVGHVEEITIRDTHLRKLSDELVLLPNSVLFKNAVEVKTDRPHRRYEAVVGVAYGEDADNARDVIFEAVKKVEGVVHDRGIDVFAREFGESSIDFLIRWWAGSSMRDMYESQSSVILAVKAALDEAGIEIPFPYRTLTFPKPVPVNTRPNGPENLQKDSRSPELRGPSSSG